MLDLAAENPVDPQQILEFHGDCPSTRVLHATEFGAQRAARGWDPAHQRGYSEAIEAMMTEARLCMGRHTDLLIAGRAGLASFAELGLRLSSWHEKVTLVNRRRNSGQWDMCSIRGRSGDSEPFFDQIRFPSKPKDTRGRVAVVVSSGHPVDQEKVERFFAAEREELLATVTLRVMPPEGTPNKIIHGGNTPDLAQTLCEELEKVKGAYPGLHGLAVFVAGPAQLAFLVGRAINPNVYASVWFPHWHDDRYAVGSKIPWVDKVRVRMFMANPSDGEAINLLREEIVACEVLGRPRVLHEFDVSVDHAATLHDLFDALLRDRPQIIHFAGHGSENALGFVTDEGDKTDVVPGGTLVDTLRSASDRIDPPRLVVLNACKSSAQAKALVSCVDFAIGMPYNVKDSRAIAFTRRFYDGLASGRTLQNAFDQAHAYLSKWGERSAENLELHSRPGCDAAAFRFGER